MNWERLKHDLRQLSYAYTIAIDDDYKSIVVRNFNLPPGYNFIQAPVMLILPKNYPENSPGIGSSKIYVPDDLRYEGREPEDFHSYSGPDGWAWWCYEWIDWKPHRDNLIIFFEMLRAHMTNPL